MGFNTTVVVLNDALHQIAEDTEFGKKLSQACLMAHHQGPQDVSAGNHMNAATAIESHHASTLLPVLVGGNFAFPLKVSLYEPDHSADLELLLLKKLAESKGFYLRKKPSKKKKA